MLRLVCRALLVSLLAVSVSAQAEIFGFLDGRGASPGNAGEMSIEAGYADNDAFTTIGGRFNFQFSPALTLYADFVKPDADLVEGSGYGAGVRYHLANQQFLSGMDVSVRASFHTVEFENSLNSAITSETDSMSVALHIGSQQPITGNIKWYGVLSYNTTETEGLDGDSEVGYGGGVYMPLGPGIAYAGLDNIDEMIMGVGYRYFLGGR